VVLGIPKENLMVRFNAQKSTSDQRSRFQEHGE